MPARSDDSVVVLHLSDLQFGRFHRFGALGAGADFDSLFGVLRDDLKALEKEFELRPDLVIVTGDLAELGMENGLLVYAGHGLNTDNVGAVAAVPQIEELNIGHAIVSRAVLFGMEAAVREMLTAMATS